MEIGTYVIYQSSKVSQWIGISWSKPRGGLAELRWRR
jgi:hypothetical protein